MSVTTVTDCPTHDVNVFLHALRTQELRRMPQGAATFLSGGCAGEWYFRWIRENYPGIRRHIGLEAYAPKPDTLPPEVEWIADYLGNMVRVPTASVDLVFAGQTIEHVWPDDLANFLCEANRVLRPGGVLVLDSPNRRITTALGWFQPQHTAELLVDEIVAMVQLAGFEVTAVRGVWLCYDRASHHALPFEPAAPAPLSYKERIARSADHPEDCFIWWLEAQKTTAVTPRERVAEIAYRAYDLAFSQALTRVYSQIGAVSGWGQNRTVSGAVGKSGYLVYGPYVPLRPGSYAVTFGVGLGRQDRLESTIPGDTVVAEMDVCRDQGVVLARRPIYKRDLRPGGVVELTIPLDVQHTVFGVEFRFLTHGRVPITVRLPAELTDTEHWRGLLAG